MKIQTLNIAGPFLILPEKHSDERGYFAETFRKDFLQKTIGPIEFIQDNQSHSSKSGTVRGLHFQMPPTAQAKLVRVIRGSIMDVAVDIRRTSPTYGKHLTTLLSAENLAQLYIPIGFAHGFCTLEANTEVIYKVSDYYDPKTEKGLAWDDPDLGISWPVGRKEVTISSKDQCYPRLKDLEFTFP